MKLGPVLLILCLKMVMVCGCKYTHDLAIRIVVKVAFSCSMDKIVQKIIVKQVV